MVRVWETPWPPYPPRKRPGTYCAGRLVGPIAGLHVCLHRDPIPDCQAVLQEHLITKYTWALHCSVGINFVENICFRLSFPYPSCLVTLKAFHSPSVICNDRLLIDNRATYGTLIMCKKMENVITVVWCGSIYFYNIDLIQRCSKGL